MLDIALFREGGNPELVRESQRRRFKDVEVVDRVIELDNTWRAARHKADLLNRMNNLVSKTVGEKKKQERKAGVEDKPQSSTNCVKSLDLKALNAYLETHSYCAHYWPTSLDNTVLDHVSKLAHTSVETPAVARWLQHMSSFDEPARRVFPQPTEIHQMFAGLAKEPEGTDTSVPVAVKEGLCELTADVLRPLCVAQLKEVKKLVELAVASNNASLTESETKRDSLLKSIGNLVHDSVVVSKDEANNGIVRSVGEQTHKKYSHVDLVHMIGGVDSKRGTVTAGGRGYYLLGPCVALERAVVELALELLRERDYVEMVTPFFVRRDVMTEVAQLEQFDEELYKVSGKSESGLPEDDKYLIATSEQPIAAFHRDEWLPKDALPKKYAGLSYCFRQEVGSHGRDTRGIFRVHQFQKVEQFVLTSPHDDASWQTLDAMMDNAEALCKALGLSYQVVNIVSGELNNAAAKKLDLEAWFPASAAYRELVSCSNCTDYQSRRLRVRHGATKQMNAQVEYVHMLNGTMCASTRVICALLETHQTEDGGPNGEAGVVVPQAIRKYMPAKYREFIKFEHPAPIDEEEKKQKKNKAPKK